jgi:signal recognition particle subunit SRP68
MHMKVYMTLFFYLFQNFKAAQRGQAIEGKISNQHYLHSYLMYIRLSKTVERNLLMIDKLKQYLPGKPVPEGHKITKPQDLVRLYDIIIQVNHRLYVQLHW